MVLGLKDNEVRLQPYTPLWQGLFWLERCRIQTALGHYAWAIHHVGSTAIPGMRAKPTLEIVVAIADIAAATPCIDRMQSLGYDYQGENIECGQHRLLKGDPPAYTLYLMESDNPDLQDKLRFRDALKHSPALARDYAVLKGTLARKYPHDRVAYQLGKAYFIQQVLKESRLPSA